MKGTHIILLFILFTMLICPTVNPAADKIKRLNVTDQFSILYQQDSNSQISVIQIAIRGGKAAEMDQKKGLAYLTTRLTLETQSRGDLMELMTFGSVIYCNIFGDFSVITIRSLSQNFPQSVKLFLKNFTDPLFSSIRIKPLKDSMIYSQKSEQDSPLAVMFLNHFQAFYQDSGYGGSVYGTKESLKKIKSKDIKHYYKNYFALNNMVVSVCTDLPEKKIIEIFKPFAKKIKSGTAASTIKIPGSLPQKKHIFISKDKRQTIVSFAFLLPKIDRKEFALSFLLENLLGKEIGSKLWYLRSHHQLAYSVAAEFTHYIHSGVLSLNLRTQNDKKKRAFSEFQKLINQLQQEGITAEEFSACQAHAAADFFRQNESKDRKAILVAYFAMMDLGPDFFLELPEILSSITLEDFNAFLKKILYPQNRVTVIIGPEDISQD